MTKPYAHTGYRVEFNRRFANERDFASAERAQSKPPRVRRLTVDGVRYAAWDAHQLLETESAGIHARPGHPLG
jgi:hypothetical protein